MNHFYCSFCGKRDEQVFSLVAGIICDECVALCSDIIEKKRAAALAHELDGER